MASSHHSSHFDRLVYIDGDALATSRPLDVKQLDRIFLLIEKGLSATPTLRKEVNELRTKFTQKLFGSGRAVSFMVTLLEPAEDALEYFKSTIVKVLKGHALPFEAPRFASLEVAEPEPELSQQQTPSAAAEEETKPSAPANALEEKLIKKPEAATRKRTLDASSTMDTPKLSAAEETKKPKITTAPAKVAETIDLTSPTTNDPPAAAAPSSSASSSKRRSATKTADEVVDPEELHPLYSLPTHWEELYYKPVEVIHIYGKGATDRISALRFAGTPFILEGLDGWMKFTQGWVRPKDGSLDTQAFLRGIHDVKVPVIEKNYDEYKPLKTHLPLGYYVKNYWEKGKSDYYMHQWQFPLTPKAAKQLCYKCEEFPVLGDNLLLYWLDAVRGDNPLQYFFMGQRSTTSRMHQDAGGLDITIAPIVGTKRVTMLHKSASKLDSVHETVNFHDVDLDKSPLLAFIPAWRVDVKPGQILYMPEGTFHACENITACLSYHRFHVDHVNLPGFLASFMAQDSPSINHAEILWNASHDVMAALEEIYHANGKEIDNSIATLRKLDSLRALRHAARVLSLESALPTEDSWDWNKLLEDIDHLMVRIDTHALQNAKKHHQGLRTTVAAAAAAATTAPSSPLASSSTGAIGNPSSTSSSIRSKGTQKVSSSHWDDLNLRVGDIIGVQVFEKRNRAEVLKIALNMELVQIHYVDWGSIYDEFLPVSSLFQRSRGNRRVPYKKAPKVHETVLARWGSNGQLYNAIVLKVIRSNACLVHYLKYEKDWDQWILPGHIFKKYDAA